MSRREAMSSYSISFGDLTSIENARRLASFMFSIALFGLLGAFVCDLSFIFCPACLACGTNWKVLDILLWT